MIPTNFASLIGNEAIKVYLERMVAKKAVSHSLLFAGPDGVGKSLFAYGLAAQLICEEDSQGTHRQKIETGNHPDIHLYRPEGKLGMHSIQALRQLSEETYLPPYEALWKVFIIHEADRMLSYSANALLKTFEEPPLHTIIILLSSAPAALLPTVISRCCILHFQPLTKKDIEEFLRKRYPLEEEKIQHFAHLARGSLSRAIYLAEQGGDFNRDLILKVLAQGKAGTYKALVQMIQTLTEQLETIKKHIEESAKEELYHYLSVENLSAYQHHALEKELEGAVTMGFLRETNALLEHILFWYRDLHLLRLNGQQSYLMNQGYHAQLEQALQRGNLISLEQVQKAIKEAHLSLQRSTALNICLENLFLKLDLI